MSPQLVSASAHQKGNGLTRILDTIGNIWFGVTMLVVIFIYSSIGSAVPLIRQGAMADWLGLEFLRFDKSEMEWFCWWPFQLQIGLLCLALILVTIRKIPLTIVNAGVWTIHTGIITLAVSSMIYFGTKVEGDAVVFQSRALILAPGMTQPVSMVIRPEASIDAGLYHIKVDQIIPSFPLQTEGLKGKSTQAIWLNVQSMAGGQNFTRILLVGYPKLTEDVVSGKEGMQRVKKLTGGKEQLLDKDLQIHLDTDPANYFYYAHSPPVRSTGAIYARFSPEDEWTQIRFSHLPHYYERLMHRDELWQVPGAAFPPVRAALDLKPEMPADAGAVGKLDYRITDYLPYANLDSRWVESGTTLNPYVRVRLATEQGEETYELLALSADRRRQSLGQDLSAEFVWAASAEQRAELLKQPRPQIAVQVASKKIDRKIEMSALYRQPEPMAIEGTDYRVEVRELFPEGLLGGTSPAIALLRVKKGEAKFDRVVLADEKNGGRDIDENLKPLPQNSDADIKFEYLSPSPQRLLVVAGPDADDALDVVLSRVSGTFQHAQAKLGEALKLTEEVGMTVEEVLPHARLETRPAIVPPGQRQSLQDVGKSTSLVRLEVNDGQRIQSVWLPFSQYAFFDDQRAQPGRFNYSPRIVRLSDGRQLWLLYSRWRDPLPSPVALDRFMLQTYPGGDRASDYISLLRFKEGGEWSPLVEVKSNKPAQHGDLWYFQAQWDPGVEAHTVLGVGNRRAVHAMLAGVCISISGMIYAFYFKPAIIRRRKQRALAGAKKKNEQLSGSGSRGRPQQAEVSHA